MKPSESRGAFRWAGLIVVILALVIVPWLLWGEPVAGWFERWVSTQPARSAVALIVFGLLALDIFLPVPSSFVAAYAGVALGVGLGALASTAGLVISCVIGYGVAADWGRRGARRWVGPQAFEQVERSAQRYGDSVVLLLRPVPVLAEASVFFAGMTRVPFGRFFALSTLANALIATVYAWSGSVSASSGRYELVVLVACALPFAGILWARRIRGRLG